MPVGLVAGGITSTVNDDHVAAVLGPYLCPEGSQAEPYTYPTTILDSNGFEQPSTGYATRCIGSNGETTKDLGPMAGFLWIGIFGVTGVLISAPLALLLAAPAGVLITKLFHRQPNQDPNTDTN